MDCFSVFTFSSGDGSLCFIPPEPTRSSEDYAMLSNQVEQSMEELEDRLKFCRSEGKHKPSEQRADYESFIGCQAVAKVLAVWSWPKRKMWRDIKTRL